MYLEELTIPITKLQGIGPSLGKDLNRLGIHTIADLLLHLPRGYEDRSKLIPLISIFSQGGKGFVNTIACVEAHEYFWFGSQKTLKILIRDSTASAELVCYGRNFLARKYPPGIQARVAGIFTYQYKRIQSSTFELDDPNHPSEDFSSILPIYPLSGRLSQRILRKILRNGYSKYGRNLKDELPESFQTTHSLLPISEALRAIHFPKSLEEPDKGRRSLAFRELFSFQIEMIRRGLERKVAIRPPRKLPVTLRDQAIVRLPFSLTEDQRKSLIEIDLDIEGPSPMARLLQGDVGSGKTLVAFLAALRFAEGGIQTAFMAPTELLARQHAENAAKVLEPLGVRLAFYSGKIPLRNRKPLLQAVSRGEVDIIIGTHALFSEEVRFANLGFVVIDEQHRFGVDQRKKLAAKGIHPDILLMSATPIPRTLALSVFGDLEVSELKSLPPGRRPVETHLARIGNEEKVYAWVERELQKGHQAYFVYPLIEGDGDLKDAETMYQHLQSSIFPKFRVGLIHARLSEEEQRSTMEAFVKNQIQVLVATSIVEVGVDVPNATCMVIEHAERFGLSALHQLRGRVGRGNAQSYAFLVYDPNLTDLAKERLKVLKETTDGFRIAEEDLRLRGPGDMVGVRQSGLLDFSIAQLPQDMELMVEARKEALKVLAEDPGLLRPEHGGLRFILDLRFKDSGSGVAP
ncbi:MAG: ATP-dependent DNA helicase RecG [Spirochaetes bacterium]|nr:ATP-dependent DNA helicase RecG [Spirochaetota bacterium]